MINEFENIKSECLKPVAEAFARNLARTGAFSMLPTEMICQMAYNDRIESNAIFVVTGRGILSMKELLEVRTTKPASEVINQEFQTQFANAVKSETAETTITHRHLGIAMVDRFIENSDEMKACMDALLTSITLESYLFFESFCSDLWVVGVDNWTPKIAERMLQNQTWERSETKAASTFRIASNPKTHPGSFWREIGMVSFQRLDLIQRFFGIAFGGDARKLFDSTDGGFIYALSAFRNCIAHRGGRVDLRFKEDTQRFPEFNSLNISNTILLDGDLVKRLRNAAAETGLALLNHVDGILQSGI